MNAIERQMTELAQRIDSLQEIIERLTYQITELTSGIQHQSKENHSFSTIPQMNSYSFSHQKNQNALMEHKDVLLDGNGWDNESNTKSEQMLSPDIQIRRLTAQLTAAYNRIAALEEQLLSRRIHS